jgi:hypothetical protein
MSVEVDFFQANQVFQAANTQAGWVLSASFFDSNHYYGVSFVPDSEQSALTLISLSYEKDIFGNVTIPHTIQTANNPAVWRVALIEAPSKF